MRKHKTEQGDDWKEKQNMKRAKQHRPKQPFSNRSTSGGGTRMQHAGEQMMDMFV